MQTKYAIYDRKEDPINFIVEEYGRVVTGTWQKYNNIDEMDELDIRRLPFVEKKNQKTYFNSYNFNMTDTTTISIIVMVCSYDCESVKKSINVMKRKFNNVKQIEDKKSKEDEDIKYYGKISSYKYIKESDYKITYSHNVCFMCDDWICSYRTCSINNRTFQSYKKNGNRVWTKIYYGSGYDNKPKMKMKNNKYLCDRCYIKYC